MAVRVISPESTSSRGKTVCLLLPSGKRKSATGRFIVTLRVASSTA
jgi:hypothetical protein